LRVAFYRGVEIVDLLWAFRRRREPDRVSRPAPVGVSIVSLACGSTIRLSLDTDRPC
jgi:hypothetical protein